MHNHVHIPASATVHRAPHAICMISIRGQPMLPCTNYANFDPFACAHDDRNQPKLEKPPAFTPSPAEHRASLRCVSIISSSERTALCAALFSGTARAQTSCGNDVAFAVARCFFGPPGHIFGLHGMAWP